MQEFDVFSKLLEPEWTEAFEWFSAVLLLMAVWLNARNSAIGWPFAIVGLLLSLPVYIGNRLYADTGLTAIYVLLSAYGWWAWLHGGTGEKPLKVSFASQAEQLLLIALATFGTVGLGLYLHYRTDAAIAFWDSATTCFSLAAQYLLARRKIQNWIWWIIIDVFYVGIYIYRDLYVYAALFAVYVLIAAVGYLQWRKIWYEESAVSQS